MTFQSTIRLTQTTGIIGEIIRGGPCRVRPLNVNSNGGTPNTVGKAFTFDASVDDECGPGDVGGGAFAGVLTVPKNYALAGTVAGGSLAPTLDLPDQTNAEILSMGSIITNLDPVGTGKIGEGIFYDKLTGVLGSGTATTAQTQITNAKIDMENITGAGLAIITLTEPE